MGPGGDPTSSSPKPLPARPERPPSRVENGEEFRTDGWSTESPRAGGLMPVGYTIHIN